MPLTVGSQLGSYEVVAKLGEGGMGEVYRARDTKLQRDVALKILTPTIADDADRLARFSREAQVLAALNHPNIAAIYGFESNALIMELVDGPTLADRLVQGPLPLDEALAIATQITEALTAAHDSGIVHRDLKPANIKVRPDGTVKVLDFGLAKALEPAGATENLSNSPTLSVHATQQGIILGTAGYMAPEQARGRAVDRRADIWAFGVVLYEMLAGRRLFDGDDVSITLAAVLKDEINWQALPADLPSPVRRLLRRCLERDPRRRLSSMADARLELDDAASMPADPAAAPAQAAVASSRLPWVVAAVMAATAVAVTAMWRPWQGPPPAPRVTFAVTAPDQADAFGGPIAISPDGRYLLTRARESGAQAELWLHSFETNAGAPLPGTRNASWPFWSPDSRQVGFFADGKVKRLDIGGGAPTTIVDALSFGGGTWNADGVIIFAAGNESPILRVSANGGDAVPITTLDTARGEIGHRYPTFLPDGVHYVYLVASTDQMRQGAYLGSLGSTDATFLTTTAGAPVFAAPDQLLFVRDGRLMAQRLDVSARTLAGEPVPVAEGVVNANNGLVRAHASGAVLAYQADDAFGRLQLGWMNADGSPGTSFAQPALYDNPRLSPDGTRVAVTLPDTGGGDIWILDVARNTKMRFTTDDAADGTALWSPDGKRIAFVSSRDGGVANIYVKAAGGTGQDELLLKTERNKALNDWSADGRYLLYEEQTSDDGIDLWVLPLTDGGNPGTPELLVSTSFNERSGAFSPDGKWFAYVSNEGGGNQAYVQTFPVSGTKWLVSPDNGWSPRWQADGKRLFYDRTGTMTAVDLLELTPERFRAGDPQALFRGLVSMGPHNYDIGPDGRFLVLTRPSATFLAPITVVQNWKPGGS